MAGKSFDSDLEHFRFGSLSRNAVELLEYLMREREPVGAGTPIATVESYWAIMRLNAVDAGIFRKSFFDHNETVKIGDTIGIVAVDGEDLIYDRENLTVQIIETKRARPGFMDVARQVMRDNDEVLGRLAKS